jgi:hypothetical protein
MQSKAGRLSASGVERLGEQLHVRAWGTMQRRGESLD